MSSDCEYDKVAQQCADEAVDYSRYLFRLTELELLHRERRATERRIQQGAVPVVKSLDSFEFLATPSLNKLLVLELARGEFIGRRECVLVLGNSGTGKTQRCVGIGLGRLVRKAIACTSPPWPRWYTSLWKPVMKRHAEFSEAPGRLRAADCV